MAGRTTLLLLAVVGVAGAWSLGVRSPQLRLAAPRCLPFLCQEQAIPESVTENIPPGQLADAWRRDEKAKELNEALKGCSLYLVGTGVRKNAIGRVLARRLTQYRFYELPSLMCSTYQTLSKSSDKVSLQQLLTAEPLADVEALASALLQEVQQYTRCVHVVWDGAVSTANFMVMQQGIVVNVATQTSSDETLALPSVEPEATLETWLERHKKADVTVELKDGVAADDAAYELIEAVLAFIAKNPAKSKEWKLEADNKMTAPDGSP